jgi:hypothetical protein
VGVRIAERALRLSAQRLGRLDPERSAHGRQARRYADQRHEPHRDRDGHADARPRSGLAGVGHLEEPGSQRHAQERTEADLEQGSSFQNLFALDAGFRQQGTSFHVLDLPGGASDAERGRPLLQEALASIRSAPVAAIGLARAARSLLFGLEPADPLTLIVSIALLGANGLWAGWLPARRASRIDPNLALQHD